MATMANSIGKAPSSDSNDLLSASVSSSPWPFLEWQKELRECLDNEDFSKAGQVLARKGLKEFLLDGFFDEPIRDFLCDALCKVIGGEDQRSNDSHLLKLIRRAEFLHSHQLGSPFTRLSLGAAYRCLGEQAKLQTMMTEICRPRGPYEPSDLFTLKQDVFRTEMGALVEYFFKPLHTSILDHLEGARQPFPIGKVAEKV
jgi:hypothetical protein